MTAQPDAARFPEPDRGAIAFGEKLLNLLDLGVRTATYKFAVLLALIDLCLEHATTTGAPPSMLTTEQFAEKIIELYWPHTLPFAGRQGAVVLRQNTGGQAEIISMVEKFRVETLGDPSATLTDARRNALEQMRSLVRRVESKLIEMPLPKLQLIGRTYDPFIYELGWTLDDRRRGRRGADFDNRILLVPGAGESLVRLAGLLRPLIQRQWSAMVSRLNRDTIDESKVEDFLFGVERVPTLKVRSDLRELQGGRCYYCDGRLRGPGDVDHFIPWARYPDNGIGNLVIADGGCNNAKRHFLAAADHVSRWSRRFDPAAGERAQLNDIAERAGWETGQERTISVARAIYLRLPSDARLWHLAGDFVAADVDVLRSALGGEVARPSGHFVSEGT